MNSNLPPGVNESDLPGNRPEDEWNDAVTELLSERAWDEIADGSPIGIRLMKRWDECSPNNDPPEYVAGLLDALYLELKDEEDDEDSTD